MGRGGVTTGSVTGPTRSRGGTDIGTSGWVGASAVDVVTATGLLTFMTEISVPVRRKSVFLVGRTVYDSV